MISRRALLSTGIPSRASASCAVSNGKTCFAQDSLAQAQLCSIVINEQDFRHSELRSVQAAHNRFMAGKPGTGVPGPKHSADEYNGRETRVPRSASLHSPDPAYSRAADTVHRHDGGVRAPGRWRKSPASHRVKSLLAWLLLPLCGHCHCGGTLL